MRIDPIQPTFLKRMFEHIVKRRIKLRNLHESNSRSKQTESRLPHNLMFHLRLGKHTRSIAGDCKPQDETLDVEWVDPSGDMLDTFVGQMANGYGTIVRQALAWTGK